METVKLPEPTGFGPEDQKIFEALQVTQMFNGFTKIADALRLGPDGFAAVLT